MQQHESSQSCECGVCKVSHFERNNYFHGKLLSARDLKAEQLYFNEKRWLINRMILGWGIVCGLEVKQENGCLVIEPGLALDCCGHELLVCEQKKLGVKKIANDLRVDPCAPFRPIRWVLCLEYSECKTEPVKLPSACGDDELGEHNRIRDHYQLTVRELDEDCFEDQSDDCCPYERLGCDPIHKVVLDGSRKCPKCKDCECVLLAIGTLERGPGDAAQFSLDEDFWKYQRVVYTNPALANLIRCFHKDLAHIKAINWAWKQGAHYDVDAFLDLLTRQRLKVTFDQPLREHTVKDPKSFRLSIFIPINEGGCPVHVLIPLERIEYSNNEAVYYFDDDCIERQMRRCRSLRQAVEVELVLHGSMILDKKGRALDAELIEKFPTGNGVEGGEFITYFTVGP